ncbi:hypothetical protein FRB94_003960 [Tulasnella sp. JGI-2019a]|nr:hypothetical protein FRB93_000765 [Tulasnella sp. JGI-2019a]KAG8985247.1 hypothetical protein FRB94_003960 [Tulasnella sp. JGI-2019a]
MKEVGDVPVGVVDSNPSDKAHEQTPYLARYPSAKGGTAIDMELPINLNNLLELPEWVVWDEAESFGHVRLEEEDGFVRVFPSHVQQVVAETVQVVHVNVKS